MLLSALDRGRKYLLFHASTLDETNLRILDFQFHNTYKKSILTQLKEREVSYFERLSSICRLDYTDAKNNTLLFSVPINFLPKISASVDIDSTNVIGETALHHAVINNDIERVKVLLSLGANRYIQDMRNKTPLEHAEWNNFYDIATVLRC